MAELGGGWYKYAYSGYDPATRITFRCNSGTADTDFRYTWGSNSDDLQVAGKLPSNYFANASSPSTVIDGGIEALDGVVDTVKLDTEGIISALGGAGAALTSIYNQTSQLTFSGANVQARIADAGDLSVPTKEDIAGAVLDENIYSHMTISTTGDALISIRNGVDAITPFDDTNILQAVADLPTVEEINDELELWHGTGDWDAVADLAGTNTLINNGFSGTGVSLTALQAAVAGIDDADTIAEAVRAEMDSSSTALAGLATSLARVLGLVHENIYQVHTYDVNGNNTGSTVELYNSKANAQAHDGTTGIVAKYTLTAVYDASNLPTSHRMVRDS
jgi:hypothetical protein